MASACIKKPDVVGSNVLYSRNNLSFFLNLKVLELYKHMHFFFLWRKPVRNEMSIFVRLFHPFVLFLVNGYLCSCLTKEA